MRIPPPDLYLPPMKRNYGNFVAGLILLLCCFPATMLQAQDTLPSFSAVRKPGNKVLISWTNPYGKNIRQLSIQRSNDSARLFKSIVSIPDPVVLKNGYVDAKSPDTSQYYRLYILLDSGRYVFSKSRRAVKYVAPPPAPPVVKKPEGKPKAPPPAAGVRPPRPELTDADKDDENRKARNNPAVRPTESVPKKPAPPPAPIIPERIYQIKRADTLKGTLLESKLKRFRDSINLKTKDTLVSIVNDTLIIKPFIAKEVFKTSRYIFTDKSGLLHIELPEATRRAYQILFYEEDKTFLFEVKNIKDQVLLIDKANFQHAGWFLFELIEDGKMIEKNRFFIGKDF